MSKLSPIEKFQAAARDVAESSWGVTDPSEVSMTNLLAAALTLAAELLNEYKAEQEAKHDR